MSGLITPARADELAEKGREVFKQNQQAVVSVRVALNIWAPGTARTNEAKLDITGTVVDSSGLTVLSLSASDPTEMYQRMMTGEGAQPKLSSAISQLKILLNDGTEVPAEMVSRNKDLDLAFIRPKAKPAKSMAAVDLGRSAHVQVLDQVITLSRLNTAADRAYAAAAERISAVIQQPRTFYIPENSLTSTALGSPVFALDGSVIGVVVMRTVQSAANAPSSPRDNVTGIILPATDILAAEKQALATKSSSGGSAQSQNLQPTGR